jgi:hypothetical protein
VGVFVVGEGFMKSILLLFLSISTCFGQDPPKDYVFLVVYAEGARSSSQELKSLDYIKSGDVITVRDSGNLVMMHESGFPVEFEGDTIVPVDRIHLLIKSENQNSFDLSPSLIRLLFISTPKGLKNELTKFAWIRDQHHQLERWCPPTRFIDISKGLHLDWRDSHTDAYRVTINNINGDSLATFYSATSDITVSPMVINKIIIDSVAVIRWTDQKHIESSNEYVLKRVKSKIPMPYSDRIDKPSFALYIALKMEFSESPDLSGAEEYYTLATKLSDREFYQKMLLNFRARRKR